MSIFENKMPMRGRNNIPLKISETWYENIYTLYAVAARAKRRELHLSRKEHSREQLRIGIIYSCNKIRERDVTAIIFGTYVSRIKLTKFQPSLARLSRCITYYAAKHTRALYRPRTFGEDEKRRSRGKRTAFPSDNAYNSLESAHIDRA